MEQNTCIVQLIKGTRKVTKWLPQTCFKTKKEKKEKKKVHGIKMADTFIQDLNCNACTNTLTR